MFIGCDNLTAIDFPEIANFDTTKMYALFGVISLPRQRRVFRKNCAKLY